MSLCGRVAPLGNWGQGGKGGRQGKEERKEAEAGKFLFKPPVPHMRDRCMLTGTLSGGETAWNTTQNTDGGPRGGR